MDDFKDLCVALVCVVLVFYIVISIVVFSNCYLLHDPNWTCSKYSIEDQMCVNYERNQR